MRAFQRVPSDASIGDSTNIWNSRTENEQSLDNNSNYSYARRHGTHTQKASEEGYPFLVPIYHNINFIGQISLKNNLLDPNVTVPDDEVELDFYIVRYFKVVDYYLTSNQHKVPRTDVFNLKIKDSWVTPSSPALQWGHVVELRSSKQSQARHTSLTGVANSKSKKSESPNLGVKGFKLQSESALFKSVPKQVNSSDNKKISPNVDVIKSKVTSNENPYTLELIWLRRCIKAYLPNMRQLYDHYNLLLIDSTNISLVGSNVTETPFEPHINRLAFWQLLRDHGLHKQFDSLVALENLIWQNPYVQQLNSECILIGKKKLDVLSDRSNQGHLSVNILDPFQSFCFSQFVHNVLEISWVLYSGHRSTQNTPWPTHLTGCLYRLMTETLATHTEEGKVLRNRRYSCMIPAVFSHFKEIGNPLPLPQFLSLLKPDESYQQDNSFSMSELCKLIHESDGNKSDPCGNKANDLHAFDDDIPDMRKNCNINKAHCNVNNAYSKTSTINSCESVIIRGLNANSSRNENVLTYSHACTSTRRSCLKENGSQSNTGIDMNCELQADDNKSLSMVFPKSFLVLDMQEILNAVAQICPKMMSRSVVVNINIALNFLEYYEVLVHICELNASKTQRVVKSEATRHFYKEFIKPVIEEDHLTRKKQKVPTRNEGSQKKGKKGNKK